MKPQFVFVSFIISHSAIRFIFDSDHRCRQYFAPSQVDLGQDKIVTGVVIQGGKHRDRNVFMKKFKVGHSLDGEEWTMVKEENTTRVKVGSLIHITAKCHFLLACVCGARQPEGQVV